MRTILVAIVALFALVSMSPAQELNLMPEPASVRLESGQLSITQSFTVAIAGEDNARTRSAANRLISRLSSQTGLPLNRTISNPSQASLILKADKAGGAVQKLGEDESYTLVVTPSSATLSAPTDLGIVRGVETFLQLVQAGPTGYVVPAVTIQDKPRFQWRGLMIDSARHFQPVEVIERNLDAMAAVKMNVLHWHLSDNQGFRVESKKFPKLHQLGSNGLYYSQDDVRSVIAYAHDRGIRVVPEIDMPGHDTAMFVGYPELASAPGPYAIEKQFGIFDPAMDPTREETYKFIDKLVGEMADLFPDQFFHIGGDEVNGKQWDANPEIQAFKRAHNMKSSADLQAYFTNRVQKIVQKHKKTMIGWDEVQHPDIPTDVVIHSWRGPQGLANAAHAGYRSILSYGYYIDLMFPASQHYLNEPLAGPAANLTPEQQSLVLGGEATMWSEYATPENIDSRIWPRTAAIAERFWSPQSVNSVDSMYRRLDAISQLLEYSGVTHNSFYRPALERIAGPANAHALQVLADILEPPKGYDREGIERHLNTTDTAYVRLVDVVRPESSTARLFGELVERTVTGTASPEDKARVRAMLVQWRDNDRLLQGAFQSSPSFLQKEILPVSAITAQLSTAGLQALNYMESGSAPSQEWVQQQLALLDQAKKPQSTMLIMIAEPIQRLVQATVKSSPAASK